MRFKIYQPRRFEEVYEFEAQSVEQALYRWTSMNEEHRARYRVAGDDPWDDGEPWIEPA